MKRAGVFQRLNVNGRILLAAFALLWLQHVAVAQKGDNPRRDEQRENERVGKAERLISDAKKDLSSIQNEIRQVMGGLEKAANELRVLRGKLREARDDVEDRLGAEIGIPEALAKVRKAGRELEEISVALRSQIHETTEWKTTQESSQRARERRSTLLNSLEETGKDNDEKLKTLAGLISKPVELENLAITADAKGTRAKHRLDEVQLELERKRKLLPKGVVERDMKVIQLQSETDKAEKKLSELESSLRKKQIDAARIQKRFAEAQVELRKARLADAADSNKPLKGTGK